MANDHGLDFDKIRHALGAGLSARGRHAGRRLRRRAVPVQGHHAAGGVHRQPVRPRACGHAGERGPAALSGQPARAQYDLATLRVGILGMAFKAESDDIRSSLSYKLKHILEFRCKEVLCTDPYVTDDPSLVPLEAVLAQADMLIIGAPHSSTPTWSPTSRSSTCGTCAGTVCACEHRGLGDHPGLSGGRCAAARPRPDLRRHPVRARGADHRRQPTTTTRSRWPTNTRRKSRGSRSWSTPTAGGRRTRSGTGSITPTARSRSSRWPTAATTRRQIDDLARLVDRGVAVAAASRYTAGGQQVGGPRFKSLLSRGAGLIAGAVRPGRHPRRDEQLQGLQHRLRPRGRHRQPDRLRDRSGTDGQGPPAAAPGRRDPDGLARSHDRQVQLRHGRLRAALPVVVLLRLRAEADARAAAERSGQRVVANRQLRQPIESSRRAGNVVRHVAAEGSGHRLGRLHRRLCRRGVARARLQRRRHRQLLEVRQGRRRATTTTRTTTSSRAMSAISSC